MFTGLVEEVGVVRRLERTGGGGRLAIGARRVLEGTRIGDSIAVSGACLTVVALGREDFTVDCMPETLKRTTLGAVSPGAEVNLERSLTLGARLGGHLVTGHVDAIAEVIASEEKDGSVEVTFSLPVEVRSYVVEKGSVAVNGVSLTVMRTHGDRFVVGLIPHTLGATTLGRMNAGGRVNVEADILARYVRRSLETYHEAAESPPALGGGLTEELLREKGFA